LQPGPGLRDWVLVTVVFLAGVVLGALALALLMGGFWHGQPGRHLGLAGAARAGLLGVVALSAWGVTCIWLLLVRGGRLGWADLGLRPMSPAQWGAWAIIVVLSSIGLAAVAGANALLVNHGHPVSNVQVVIGGLPLDAVTIALAFIAVAVAAPLAEELYFRGLMYQAFRRHWGVAAATVASAVFFSAAHLLPPLALVLLYMGVVLALVFQWLGSLRASIALHALNNAMALLVGLEALQRR
jgi:membrane protease YdiL (CAAX protease family)